MRVFFISEISPLCYSKRTISTLIHIPRSYIIDPFQHAVCLRIYLPPVLLPCPYTSSIPFFISRLVPFLGPSHSLANRTELPLSREERFTPLRLEIIQSVVHRRVFRLCYSSCLPSPLGGSLSCILLFVNSLRLLANLTKVTFIPPRPLSLPRYICFVAKYV